MVSLLGKGADPNADDVYGGTPLHCAARSGNTRLATILLANGADIHAKEHTGVIEGSKEWGVALGRSAIHFAAINGKAEMVELLLGKGADINAADYRGDTPLDYAYQYYVDHLGDSRTTDLIKERGGQSGKARKAADSPKATAVQPTTHEVRPAITPPSFSESRTKTAVETVNRVFEAIVTVEDASRKLLAEYSWGKRIDGARDKVRDVILKTLHQLEQRPDFVEFVVRVYQKERVEVIALFTPKGTPPRGACRGTCRSYNVLRSGNKFFTCGDYDLP